jgi:hypothetical protein
MSAEIIDFRTWCREHRAPETTSISFPLLLPTWPWGWLQPVLLEVDVGITLNSAKSPSLPASRAKPATVSSQTAWHNPVVGSHRRTAAAASRLHLVSSQVAESHDR